MQVESVHAGCKNPLSKYKQAVKILSNWEDTPWRDALLLVRLIWFMYADFPAQLSPKTFT